MADKNIQMTQRNTSNTGWDNLYPITKASNVQVTPISGLSGTDVQTVLQNLFQFANDGKKQIANAITAKGVSASPTETFASLAAKIGQISTGKKWASGTVSVTSNVYLVVTGLTFKPSHVIVMQYNSRRGAYARYGSDGYADNGVFYTNVEGTNQVGEQPTRSVYAEATSNTFTITVANSSITGNFSWIAFE
ncbi:hypothetical protein HPJ95_05045 [Anoxybacillus flavithermus]|uniref:hypothetical protein n=1 Tax=Anoxybacillus flavithermus TaxID=33934 RepID=UPI00186753CB|nr:hypothetical protein [Anoxybacillus flavithermus]MBE2923898.1 hypothetical protein [Anoxybacillus flavithermus]